MSKRIEHLYESPCYQCGKMKECDAKIAKVPELAELSKSIMSRADYDYKKCVIWNVITMEENAV